MENIGYALCGSFCTIGKAVKTMESLVEKGYNVYPIMSENAYTLDTRFGKAEDIIKKIEDITGKKILHTIPEVEPIGPKNYLDALIIAPCTATTAGKLAAGIFDTSVTLAAKASLRNNRPLVLGISTNDGLSMSAKNIGSLMWEKNFYFVPMAQDNPQGKPRSLVCDFDMVEETLKSALKGEQIMPVLIEK